MGNGSKSNIGPDRAQPRRFCWHRLISRLIQDSLRIFGTVGGKLFFLLIFVLLPIICIQFLIYKDRVVSRREIEIQSNLELARAVSGSTGVLLRDWLKCAHEMGVLIFAERPNIDPGRFIKLYEEDHSPGIQNINFVDPQGEIISSSKTAAVGVNVSDRPYFEAILKGRNSVVSQVVQSRADGRCIFGIASGIRDDATGRFLGAVLISVDLEKSRSLFHIPRRWGGDVTILDAKGQIVFRYPEVNMTCEERDVADTYPEIKEVFEGSEVTGVSSNSLDGKSRIYAMVPIGSLGLVAMTSRIEEEAMRPVYSRIYHDAGLFFAAVVLSFLFSMLFSRSISSPIKDLRTRAMELMTGRKPDRVTIRGALEIRELCHAFNEMSEDVSKTRDDLEQRVHARTAELSQRAAQLTRLTSELTLAEQRERDRIAQVLHDDLQQLMVGAKIGQEMLISRIDSGLDLSAKRILDLINQSIRTTRFLTAELSPPVLRSGDLSASLEWLVKWMAENQGLEVHLQSEDRIVLNRPDLTVLLFQSIRELLFNVLKHAGVKSAEVRMKHEDGELRIVVSDLGVGFNPEATAEGADSSNKFGLISIYERLLHVGGRIEIESKPNAGSTIFLIVSLDEKG